MRDPATIRLLPDGRRLHLNDGPIDLIIEADGQRDDVRHAYEAAATRFVTILDELCAELPLLRSPVGSASPLPTGPIARRMADAVLPYRCRCFITPMAAVAGAVSEAVLSAMTEAAQLDRAYVNNGGDIAIHLAAGLSYTIGMVQRPEHPSLLGSIEISAVTAIRGVATSGWRGRSFLSALRTLSRFSPKAQLKPMLRPLSSRMLSICPDIPLSFASVPENLLQIPTSSISRSLALSVNSLPRKLTKLSTPVKL